MLDNNRFERGESLWLRGAASKDGEVGVYYVASDSEPAHSYQAATPWAAGRMRCSCPDYSQRGAVCKHIVAATLAEAERRIRGAMANGKSLAELKAEAIVAGLVGTEGLTQETIWRCGYEVLRLLEEGYLEVGND